MTTASPTTEQVAPTPTLVAITRYCIATTFFAVCIGQIVGVVLKRFTPAWKPAAIPSPVLIAVFLPAIVGLLLALYTVAAHPTYVPARRQFSGRFSPGLRMIAGLGCALMAVVLGFATIFSQELGDTSWIGRFTLAGMSCAFAFGTYLITLFEPEKNQVVSSLLEQTFGMAIFLIPVYLPTLLIAQLHYESLSSDESQQTSKAHEPETTDAV